MNKVIEEEIQEQIEELKNKFKKIQQKEWIKNNCRGRSSVGITFEKELGKEIEKFEIPDYKDFEIKAKDVGCSDHTKITLFCATPDSFLFIIKDIIRKYGYPDKEYPQYRVFNIEVNGVEYKRVSSNYYFKLKVNRELKRVELEVKNRKNEIIDDTIFWSFNLLEEKIYRKLKYLAFVSANRKYERCEVYYRYFKMTFYKLKEFNNFLKLIEDGNISVIFKICVYKHNYRKGEINDHGTSFAIDFRHLNKLYTKIDSIS